MSQQSTTFNSVKIGSIVVQANKAKIYAYKIDTVADWHEIKTLSGSTTLIPRGITSESFSLRIEWVPLIAGEDYKDLSANLNSLATSGELITVVLPDTTVKTRCAIVSVNEELIHDGQGKVKKCGLSLKFKCEK